MPKREGGNDSVCPCRTNVELELNKYLTCLTYFIHHRSTIKGDTRENTRDMRTRSNASIIDDRSDQAGPSGNSCAPSI